MDMGQLVTQPNKATELSVLRSYVKETWIDSRGDWKRGSGNRSTRRQGLKTREKRVYRKPKFPFSNIVVDSRIGLVWVTTANDELLWFRTDVTHLYISCAPNTGDATDCVWCVCLCWEGYTYELYKNGGTDRTSAWGRQTLMGPDNLVLDVTPPNTPRMQLVEPTKHFVGVKMQQALQIQVRYRSLTSLNIKQMISDNYIRQWWLY